MVSSLRGPQRPGIRSKPRVSPGELNCYTPTKVTYQPNPTVEPNRRVTFNFIQLMTRSCNDYSIH